MFERYKDITMRRLILIFSTFIATGCSSHYPITYATDLDGAMVVCGGELKGYTPITLYYKPDRKGGNFQTQPCEARWASGARKTFTNYWDLNEFPDGVRQTLQRPNAGDYQYDVEFALKVRAMKAQQEQANKVQVQQAWANLASDLKNLNRTLGSTPTVTPTTDSNYNMHILPDPNGYEKTSVPISNVGVFMNSSITNGYRLCEYSNGRAIRLPMTELCPSVLNP